MKKLVLLSFAMLAAAGPVSAQRTPPTLTAEQQAVRAAVNAFKDALARGDSTAALATLHDEVLIHEGGIENKTEYRSGHLAADIRAVRGLTSETVREAITVHGDFALYTRVYRTTGTNARGAQVDRTSNEAMALARTPTGWLIKSIHWF